MKKLLVLLGIAGLVMGASAVPAGAEHGTEGTVTIAGVAVCSDSEDTPGDGVCTWTSTDPNGWVGTGPFTITWDGAAGSGTFTCGVGEYCSSTAAEVDPIPVGVTVTSDGTGGGTFAAGDADQHDGS
jgi:hypothetical protein